MFSMWYASRDVFQPEQPQLLMHAPDRSGSGVREMFAAIAARYDLANHLLSLGLDFGWRRRAARIVAGCHPARILDLATGSGDLAIALQAACPSALVVGGDFCLPMLRLAQGKGMNRLVAADGMRLPFISGSFDALTVAFGLRNMASWSGALAEMARVIRPGGRLLVLDFSVPPPPLSWIYRPYLHHILPRIAAILTREKSAYDYLGASIETFPRGSEMCALIEAAGFFQATAHPLAGGIVSLYTATRTR
jgi:demethylmenaquinone methyltransferase/2-methoxy-6-polyprenyl-1,4-benzoquinol methylase